MVFSSVTFLFFFLPALLFVYYFADERFRNLLLLMASLFFYAWGEPKNVFLMIISIGANYLFGICVEKYRKKKAILAVSLVFNLGMLFVFKYLNFAVNTVNQIAGSDIQVAQIALPIGISFYTFQILSYVIDVYRGGCESTKECAAFGTLHFPVSAAYCRADCQIYRCREADFQENSEFGWLSAWRSSFCNRFFEEGSYS